MFQLVAFPTERDPIGIVLEQLSLSKQPYAELGHVLRRYDAIRNHRDDIIAARLRIVLALC